MPEEWERKGWAAPNGGWPTFGPDGKIVQDDDESAYDARSRHERAAVEEEEENVDG